MDIAQAENAPYQSPGPLRSSGLPEGYGATWRHMPMGTRRSFFEVLRSRVLLVTLAYVA